MVALVPVAASAQSEPIDLTAVFRSSGVDIADLQVYQINGIVLIRGTSADREKVENASITDPWSSFVFAVVHKPFDGSALVNTVRACFRQPGVVGSGLSTQDSGLLLSK
jgi:hypothetical protein